MRNFLTERTPHILLSNEQLKDLDSHGKVSSSMLFATTRFNAWVSACGFSSVAQMANAREETLEYFCEQYRLMLEENLDDYIKNFDKYMGHAK